MTDSNPKGEFDLEFIKSDKRARFDNDPDLLAFFRFVFVKNPIYRPHIREVISRFAITKERITARVLKQRAEQEEIERKLEQERAESVVDGDRTGDCATLDEENGEDKKERPATEAETEKDKSAKDGASAVSESQQWTFVSVEDRYSKYVFMNINLQDFMHIFL